jgi:FAD/FMN-containing dehydrogenase
LLSAFREVVGSSNVLTDEEDVASYISEWRRTYPGKARAVIRPISTEELARVVSICTQENIPLVPQGGNTGLVGGSTPDESGLEVVLSLKRMNKVINVSPLDSTITLQAGCTILEAQNAALQIGKLFALSLASEGTATVGGVLATNAGGEQVIRYGNTRDLTLGLELVLAGGQVMNLLTALRKDNTGYDLKQLFIGSEGTLGVITAATFKLHSLPQKIVTVWASVSSPDTAVGLLSMLSRQVGERVTAFEIINREALSQVLSHGLDGMRDPLGGEYEWAVLFDISESSSNLDPTALVESVLEQAFTEELIMDAAIAKSSQQSHEFWALREHIPEAQKLEGPSIKHDISVAISKIPAFIELANRALQNLIPEIRLVCFGHVGDGNLHYNQSIPKHMDAKKFRSYEDAIHGIVHSIAADLNGSISAEHGIGRLKQDDFLKYKNPVALDVMKKIKHALDPNNIFNPGRVLPR